MQYESTICKSHKSNIQKLRQERFTYSQLVLHVFTLGGKYIAC